MLTDSTCNSRGRFDMLVKLGNGSIEITVDQEGSTTHPECCGGSDHPYKAVRVLKLAEDVS